MSQNIWEPQDCGPGGSGAGGTDVENNLLCDLDAEGNLLGTALAVYTYDTNGVPVGAPTFVIPGTNTPYVVQGTLQPCDDSGCLDPVQFCFTTSTTGPVDHPGRQYDLTLPINPGFAVQSLQVDSTTSPANITWEVDDPDGEQFRQALTTFIEGRVPASATVTITNPNAGVAQVCDVAQPMTIHIECIRLDQEPPDLIELVYNGGQDLIQNPAYNESPALNPPVSQGNYGFRLLSRQDDPGPFPGNQPANDALCTSVANRGWETNDVGRTFEIWGQNIRQGEGVVPTPRGTPVQEMTSDGPPPGGLSTIWQTFVAPASGNFNIRIVHGGRDSGETHRITLTPGDTDATQGPGAIIDHVDVNIPQVTTNGGNPANPWTTFNQSIPLVGGQTYTLALSTTNPVSGARGGLFTDMRAFIDRPDLRATAATDDETCVVTVDETTTVQDAQWWSPRCIGGDIVSWRNAETGEELSNGAFWGQAPAPDRCVDTSSGSSGGSVAANLVHSYLICGEVGGVQQTLTRVVITDPSGGVLAESIIGTDGGPVAPTTWTPGACADQAFINDVVLCDDNGPFLRKYVQNLSPTGQGQVTAVNNFTLAGGGYTPVGTVSDCGGGLALGDEVCYVLNDDPPGFPVRHGFLTLDEANDPVLYSITGAVVPVGTFTQLVCPETAITTHILCDTGNANHQFIRSYFSSPAQVQNATLWDFELDGQTIYIPLGVVTDCAGADVRDTEPVLLCDALGTSFLRRFVYDEAGAVFNTTDTALDGTTVFVPTAPVGVCAVTVQQIDTETQILCDANGTRFLRRYVYDEETPGAPNITNTTLDGATAFAPVNPVGACTQPDNDFVEEVLCATSNTGVITNFIRRFTINSITNAVVATTNLTLDGAPFVIPGTSTVGSCETCCPIVLRDDLCTNTGSLRGTSLRLANGTISLIDSVSGAPITAAQVVACATDDTTRTLTAQHRLVGDADAAWSPGADVVGTLTSVTFSVLTGTATVTDQNGTVAAGLPAGTSHTWTAEDDNILTGPQSIDAVGGLTYVTWTQR